MPVPAGKTLLNAYVDRLLAERFKSWARLRGGVSAALRRVVEEAVDDGSAEPSAGTAGFQITVRLRERERELLLEAAAARGLSPATYLRSLAVVHLSAQPQWSVAEAEALRAIGIELRRIGNNVNQVARALHSAVHKGEYPEKQGSEAREAARLVRAELRRLLAIYSGNVERWGRPDMDLVVPPRGSLVEAKRDEKEGRIRAKRRPRRKRPDAFAG